MGKARTLTHRRQNGNRVAVVFVHGFGGDEKETWDSFAHAVCADPRVTDWDVHSFGYATHLRVDLRRVWRADPGLKPIAKALVTAMTGTTPFNAYQRLVLVAHSMGGLVVQRAVLDNEALRNRTDLVILYGTPSGGLRGAGWVARLKPQLRDMSQNGQFIKTLRADWNALWAGGDPGFRFWTVAGSEDEFVPRSSSLDPFPDEQQAVVPGNHLQIVRVEGDGSDDRGVSFLINAMAKDADPRGRWGAANLAVERGDFQDAIRRLEPHQADLDDEAIGSLAMAYAGIGKPARAVRLLEKRLEETTDTDAMGILAGRLKRLWLQERTRRNAGRALKLYRQGFDLAEARGNHEQAYYHAINVAFMERMYRKDREAAVTFARKALEHSAQAPTDRWRAATEAEAHLYLGKNDTALDRYRDFTRIVQKPWEMTSAYLQARTLANAFGDESLTNRLDEVFHQPDA